MDGWGGSSLLQNGGFHEERAEQEEKIKSGRMIGRIGRTRWIFESQHRQDSIININQTTQQFMLARVVWKCSRMFDDKPRRALTHILLSDDWRCTAPSVRFPRAWWPSLPSISHERAFRSVCLVRLISSRLCLKEQTLASLPRRFCLVCSATKNRDPLRGLPKQISQSTRHPRSRSWYAPSAELTPNQSSTGIGRTRWIFESQHRQDSIINISQTTQQFMLARVVWKCS